MNKIIYYSLLCFIFITCLIMLILAVTPNKIVTVNADIDFSSAKSMCVIEASSGRILREKECNIQLPMASTTKIMTALIALENCIDLDEVFDVDNRASGIEGTSMYLQTNERLTMRELLYGLMLNSGNDAATAIAYKIGGGELQNFVNMMNKKCEQLNLKNTHFANPHGLDNENHYTSSYDLALITAKAMENETFREIVSTKVKKVSGNSKVEARFLRNKHKLLGQMEGCEGVKTGFTDNARRCCVTSVKRENMRLICVVLNCQDMFEESKKQLEQAFKDYKLECTLEPYYLVGSTKVDNGKIDEIKLITANSHFYPLKQGEKDLLRYEMTQIQTLTAPVNKGQIIGKLQIYFVNELIGEEDVVALESVEENTVFDKVQDVIDKWYLGSAKIS